MKSISIYALTRKQNMEHLQKLEQQLSGREHMLKMKEWELESMRALVDQLELYMQDVSALRLFYSFQIPRLGKEFDLLQIREDQIVNIELKSGTVSEEAIQKQLIQNRYYLSVLGKPVQSYTYISSQNRLVRLTAHGHIVDAEWEELCIDLRQKSENYEGDIEDLFRAELYLISPLAEPDRFLRKEYFLTSQQRDIERQILNKIQAKESEYYWFTGLPGTGKTLLLYDIAMKLSQRQSVCMIHCGEAGRKWKLLHERLRRIEFLSDSQITEGIQFGMYRAVLVDEAHMLSSEKLHILLEESEARPMIFSSDCEDMISPKEMDIRIADILKKLPDVQTFRLTNRIRTNAEISFFIQNMMHLPVRKYYRSYPHIEIVYANDEKEAECLLQSYKIRGFDEKEYDSEIKSMAVREIERLVVILDERYHYDEEGYLRSESFVGKNLSDVRSLFHLLNQAKEGLALIIKRNKAVYQALLELL